eukprot:COSAG06_NODE_11230_length_1541_cov_1.628294_2_plen_311_part_00
METEDDVETMKAYLETMRMAVASADFAQVLDGTWWTAKSRGSASVRRTASTESHSDTDDESEVDADVRQAKNILGPCEASDGETSEVADEVTNEEDAPEDDYYGKFSGGIEGTFADLSDYFGGLEKMIGECRKDLMEAMEEEHCMVTTGFGASDDTFVTSSYRVTATPREEWQFVVAPYTVDEMDAGIDRETGRSRGNRDKIPVEKLLNEVAERITNSFIDRGFGTVVTRDDIREIGLRIEEVIALRWYTGPMFEIYNGLLRAYGNRESRGIVPSYTLVGAGQDARGRFTTTLHVLNSGVLKLAKLQPAT